VDALQKPITPEWKSVIERFQEKPQNA
jgi:hypothetical protein